MTDVGRLGTCRYLNMDRTIDEALTATLGILSAVADELIPNFFVEPN